MSEHETNITHLTAIDALGATLPFLRLDPSPTLIFKRLTTVSEVIKHCAPTLHRNNRQVLLPAEPKASAPGRRLLKEVAVASPNILHTSPIVTCLDPKSVPLPTRKSSGRKKAQALALDNMNAPPDPLIIGGVLGSEGRIPTLTCNIKLSALDAENGPATMIGPIAAIWDTGGAITVLAQELLDTSYQNYLKDDVHAPYKKGKTTQLLANLVLQFSNQFIELETAVQIRPAEELPNRFMGMLLGQLGVINAIDIKRQVPIKVLEARMRRSTGDGASVAKAADETSLAKAADGEGLEKDDAVEDTTGVRQEELKSEFKEALPYRWKSTDWGIIEVQGYIDIASENYTEV